MLVYIDAVNPNSFRVLLLTYKAIVVKVGACPHYDGCVEKGEAHFCKSPFYKFGEQACEEPPAQAGSRYVLASHELSEGV